MYTKDTVYIYPPESIPFVTILYNEGLSDIQITYIKVHESYELLTRGEMSATQFFVPDKRYLNAEISELYS